jgi:hypothetical protein
MPCFTFLKNELGLHKVLTMHLHSPLFSFFPSGTVDEFFRLMKGQFTEAEWVDILRPSTEMARLHLFYQVSDSVDCPPPPPPTHTPHTVGTPGTSHHSRPRHGPS